MRSWNRCRSRRRPKRRPFIVASQDSDAGPDEVVNTAAMVANMEAAMDEALVGNESVPTTQVNSDAETVSIPHARALVRLRYDVEAAVQREMDLEAAQAMEEELAEEARGEPVRKHPRMSERLPQ